MRPSQVTRILSGDHNMTVTSMAKLAAALGVALRIELGERADASKRASSHATGREKPQKGTRTPGSVKPVAAASTR
jgi:transcriptional regulator with XRE-family HTH domain